MQICKRFKVKFVENNIIIIIAIYKNKNLWKRHAKLFLSPTLYGVLVVFAYLCKGKPFSF